MKKILVIDDEKNIQVSLASILEDEGYKVFIGSSGEEAIEKFKNIRPDAIFLDIWLPGIDGLETMKQILEIDPFQIIIMISGHGNISTAVRAVKEGAYDFLEKPLSLDKVIFVLKRGIEYRKVLEENKKLKSLLYARNGLMDSEKKRIKKENSRNLDFETETVDATRKQKTVKAGNIFYGIGLHSGVKTGMVIKPMPIGSGIRFENISEDGYVPARIEYLDTTSYATSIKKDGLEAKTIEHFMATLHAFGITNLSIKINNEVPIGDGSASDFCEFIRNSGVVEQEEYVPEIVIEEPMVLGDVSEEGKYIKIEPYDGFAISYTTVYPDPIGRETYEFVLESPEDFEREIAPARTYGFVEDLNRMAEMGLAEGGRMNNFILIDREKGQVINTELRFKEELARHKILDIMGDFYLLGRPIRGKISAQKTGHSENGLMVNYIRDNLLNK